MRRHINGVTGMLWQWCTNVMRSKLEPMQEVARMIRRHFDGIVGWVQTPQTNGCLEALGGLFQAAERKAWGCVRFDTLRVVFFLTRRQTGLHRHQPSRHPLTHFKN